MADMHVGRAFIAPLGTPLDAPGWTEIGTADHDGLVYPEEPPVTTLLVSNGPALTLTLTCSTRFGWWRMYRDLLGETHPHAARVKREYRRRRR